jgi:hypothetical protein
MTRTTRDRIGTAAACLALPVVLLGSCAAAAAQPPHERPGIDYPLDGVRSVCDQFGHRVYLGRYGSGGTALAVVPNDVSCIKATIR